MTSSSSDHGGRRAYAVTPPRATDGIGQALRGMFGKPRVPNDMAALLRRIDQVTG